MLTHRRDYGHAHHAAGPTTVMTATSEKPGHAAMNGHGDAAVADGGGAISRVGSYCFWFADQRWEWSDEVCRMHGYEPGSVVPTTELVLSHKHPDDRAAVQDILDRALYSGASFSSRHRLYDTAGNEHTVIVVADRMFDDAGAVVGTTGYYIDITDSLDEDRREVLDETLPKVIEARAVIEQAKGALRLVYGINDEQAFSVLRWRSQQTNTKLRALAAQLVAELDTLTPASSGLRGEFDHLLLTAHQRIPADDVSSY